MSSITQVFGSVQDTDQFERVIEGLSNCKFWAYIFHDKDVYTQDDIDFYTKKNLPITFEIGDKKPVHLHFVAEDRMGIKNWANCLGIPANMICFTQEEKGGQRSAIRYLIHLDHKEKFLYNKELVHTNKPIKFESYLQDNQELSPIGLCNDLILVRDGVITRGDFLKKYEFYLAKQSFYSQYRIYTDLMKWSDNE